MLSERAVTIRGRPHSWLPPLPRLHRQGIHHGNDGSASMNMLALKTGSRHETVPRDSIMLPFPDRQTS